MKNQILLTALTALCHIAFAQVPTISSFAPASGPIGTQVIITGTNFSATAANNTVYFGAVKAAVQAATTTSLTVTVPVGATFQPITVAVNNLIAYSARPFIITYAGGGMNFTASSFSSPINLAGDDNITAADLDGDHRTDLIYGYGTNKITIYRNTSVGGSISFAPVDIGNHTLPFSITAADLNGDGLLDLVAVGVSQDSLYVKKNTSTPGSISFSSPIYLTPGTSPRRIAIGDLDGDGKADIACSRSASAAISIFRNTSVGGNITFAAKADYPNIGANIDAIAIGDLNGDGKPDIVGAHAPSSLLFVYENTSTPGNISFTVKSDNYATGTSPSTVAIADIDGDGWADMMASNSYSNSVIVYRNNGTSPLSFDMSVTVPISAGSGNMVLNDLNADGKPDIVATSRFDAGSHYTSVVKNISTPGNISFEPSVAYATTGSGTVIAADLNNDGLTDIATGDFNSLTLSIFKNQLNITVPIPQCPALLTPANNATSVNYGTPQLFSWKKDPNATGYNLRITEQSGPYTDLNTTDTFYSFTPKPGINYTWTVTPSNMVDPSQTCAGFGFSTCSAVANPYYISASADTSICSTDSVQLTTNATSNIQWFFNNQPIAGATGTSIQAKKGGAYTVRILNGSCYSNVTNTITVKILSAPAKPVLSQLNDTAFCDGGNVNFVSSLNSNNQWFKNNTVISGATGISYNATTTGDYFVRVKNGSGCYNFSDTVSVSVLAVPATPTITVTGNTTFCIGDSVKLQSTAATSYQWFNGGVPVSGATGQQYFAKTSGTYTVKTTNATNCTSAASSGIAVTTNALPAKPVITSGGTSLSTTAGFASYVWYRDNVIIAGATTNQYNTTQNGVYKVTVSDINGCKNTSDNFTYVTTGINEVTFQGYTIQLYPNPVINELNIQVEQTLSSNGHVTMVITDLTGKYIQSQTLKPGNNTIHCKTLAPGVYMVLLQQGRTEKTIKILKGY